MEQCQVVIKHVSSCCAVHNKLRAPVSFAMYAPRPVSGTRRVDCHELETEAPRGVGWFVVVTVGWAILCECSLIMQSGREAQSADFKTRTSTGAIAPASLSGLQLDFVCKALRIRTSIAKLAHLALIESTGDESEAALSSLVCKDDGCLAPSPTLSTGSVRLSRSPRLPSPSSSSLQPAGSPGPRRQTGRRSP